MRGKDGRYVGPIVFKFSRLNLLERSGPVEALPLPLLLLLPPLLLPFLLLLLLPLLLLLILATAITVITYLLTPSSRLLILRVMLILFQWHIFLCKLVLNR